MESVSGCSEERTQWGVSVAVARRGPNEECRWLWRGEDPMESVGGCSEERTQWSVGGCSKERTQGSPLTLKDGSPPGSQHKIFRSPAENLGALFFAV